MSAKLIVHKFEEGFDFKSLFITIGNDFTETTFGNWLDGITEQKKKSPENSRLIIKVVSGNEMKYIDLDSCCKEISNNSSPYANYEPDWKESPKTSLSKEKPQIMKISLLNDSTSNNERETATAEDLFKNTPLENSSIHENINPLEYSLEKVKETNARIMKNIQMLNRTLDYTKKKEVLNVVWPCSKNMNTHPCNVCGKHFVYVTGLKKHYAMRHVMTELQQQWQVVWTCTECFQVWPCRDLALNHSGQCVKEENTDCVREIKTSSLLQCEFCEKVFTSIPRLLKHSKVHTIASNYECNACSMSFQSYKNAEQHWLFCPWLNMCYKFALPKLLLCNACDRKFRNYEQLYNHRYKVNHFMAKLKIECNGKSPFLVYQCETCGEWFQSIILLQAHRNNFHPHYDSGILCKSDSFTT
ncbi:PREDICTED: zinc finger protein 729-like [Papilio polytes]|uniref:zinc finger protein 729-like n=1 Tax=Papilio polytes TaxID=76194 RepID=UPI0006767C5B|nr:PREDICTED: zinc finger protein 729-like [Papilio polytes]